MKPTTQHLNTSQPRHEFQAEATPAQIDGANDLLTAGEVAAILRVTPDWVYAQTRSRRIPHLRLGRYVRYRRGALIAWMEAVESSPSSMRPSTRTRR
jgi:excisionase family DNA binding protein